MAERFMTVTLRIQIQDLSGAELAEEAEQMGCSIDEIPQLDEVEPATVANGIELALGQREEVEQQYIWAGSEMFAKFGAIEIVECGWED